MRIKTITCHDVYNLGASLQAYALAAYLGACGHDVQIIDYKPGYLSRHYSLTYVANPRYNRPLVRGAYLLAKLPQRLKARRSLRKKRFDAFREAYLPLTARRYESAGALSEACPAADVFIAGSDQIWNPVFPNGKDPAFFLAFVPDGKKKISYAASFSVDELAQADRDRMRPWLERLNAVSVREASGVRLLGGMGIPGVQVMDPVFLLGRQQWEEIAVLPDASGYILVYDFDQSARIRQIARALAMETGKKIVSVFPMEGADEVWADMGPREFVGAVENAGYVISNSFHATAFSLIFGREFYVVNREEKINTRMRDLLAAVSLEQRLISAPPESLSPVAWDDVRQRLEPMILESKAFLRDHI